MQSDNELGLLLLQGYLEEVGGLLEVCLKDQEQRINVIDIGANIGHFSTTLLALEPRAHCMSYEPNSQIYNVLTANLNRFGSRSKVGQQAVGPVTKNATLHFVEGSSAQGSLHRVNASLGLIGGSSTREVTIDEGPIDSISLRDCFGPEPQKTLLMIDVEGYELAALSGRKSIQPNYLWIEVVSTRAGGVGVSNVAALLRNSAAARPKLAMLAR